jgi:cytochrome c oxidase cbb3-type subunit 3/ubiquinol-cytochrome c reductase cytochrome c subunit
MLANPRFLEIASDAFIQHAIVNGRPATPMESFAVKLDAQGIADVVAYVRSLAHPVTIAQLPAPTGKEPLFINPTGKAPSFTMKEGRYVAADAVKAALDKGQKLVIIDARPESEWMTVHITGAVSIPHYQLKRLDEIPKDAVVIAYCACPHHLSGIVVDELQKRGYKHAGVLDEGILEWQRRGYAVVAAAGVTMPPKEPPLPPGAIR